jgi:RNA polymerase sigma-70 factor (ECF subfamily)
MDRDRDLFWQLIEPEHLKARAFSRKLMGNREDGDDLYQDALVRALTNFRDLRQINAFRSWLYRIIINQFRNRVRSPWWRRLSTMTTELESGLLGENPVPVLAARRRLSVALASLSPNDRALVTLFELQGWRLAELSEMTGRSQGSLKVRLSRARGKMRKSLQRYLQTNTGQSLTRTVRSEDEICVVTKPAKD